MLKKHSQLFEGILFVIDLLIIACSWLFSYHVRFHSGIIPADKGVPDLFIYAQLLLPIVVIWGLAFKWFGLYRPKRVSSRIAELADIIKACVFSVLILISLTFFLRQFEFSRLIFLFFTVINIAALSAERILFRQALNFLRRQGFNIRYAIIIGTGESAKRLLKRMEAHPEVGIKFEGMLGADPVEIDRNINGVRVIGTYEDAKKILGTGRIDNVFIALNWKEYAKVFEILRSIEDEPVDIKVVPDIYEFLALRGGVEDFEGIPIVNLRNSPLYGWNLVFKRAMDIAIASVAIVLLAPLMLLIAAVIKITSPGPVLYRQERLGFGSVKTFQILKFRSMRIGAEDGTGPVWARQNDPRRTKFGTFLRQTSLDELPQIFNVLRGDMSIVGPRPERPVFISEFRKSIPAYMLRHKMKVGITGWAQVNGWRGNTDIRKRIEHDLYYIENWSLFFDVKIVWLTLWKGLVNRNAY